MWFSRKLFDLFNVSKDTVDALRTDTSTLRAENTLLIRQLADVRSQNSWVILRVNALELERTVLLEKLYGLKVAAPEIVRTPNVLPDINTFSFEDVGDVEAKRLGLPVWNSSN